MAGISTSSGGSSGSPIIIFQIGEWVVRYLRTTLLSVVSHDRLGGTHLLAAIVEHDTACPAVRIPGSDAIFIDHDGAVFRDFLHGVLLSGGSSVGLLTLHQKLRELRTPALAQILESASYFGLICAGEATLWHLQRMYL